MKKVFKKIFQSFLQGLIILAPIGITVWVVATLFTFIDGILAPVLYNILPQLVKVGDNGNAQIIPGVGFLLVIVIVVLMGYISRLFFISELVELTDKVLEKTPGIKLIYTTVKDFLEAFAGKKRKFEKAVLVNIDEKDVWQIGFLTREDLTDINMHEYVSVYIPQSFALAGRLYIVKRERIRPLENMTAAEAMKFAISGGVTEIDDDHQKNH
ncbi:DUF502 domain-containing protein [Gynurincola endophyticus]|jgi:uncharacterized membrane protein|uniref:DUF502 domain-containing protein n=1 Tax=Gynurincola endophyticus TaxID=2479004 RepID=UPI000F8CEF2D|nr:DUF502 domain-containing protein [Gynurincola endophyticus]